MSTTTATATTTTPTTVMALRSAPLKADKVTVCGEISPDRREGVLDLPKGKYTP
jgi:hypothetical protein